MISVIYYYIRFVLVAFVCVMLIAPVNGQEVRTGILTDQPFENSGYGYVVFDEENAGPCLAQELRKQELALVRERIEEFRNQGKIGPFSDEPVELTFPLDTADHFNGWALHGISNFVDHDPDYPGQLLDYECGSRTYDLPSGYNHRGIDYYTWPFAFYQMEQSTHNIVASAPGMIIQKIDGHPDRNCDFDNPNWNAVYVLHDDGSVLWYGHMKKDSTTEKEIGDFVERGEYLGQVGSSGSSTGPHLHLELYDGDGNLQDPYEGECNSMNDFSWWESQHDYYDSAINMLATHHTPPQFRPCPQTEIPNFENEFDFGETPIVAAYYRDQRSTHTSAYRVLRPNGTAMYAWNHSPDNNFQSSYWYWEIPLFENSPEGTWTFEVTYLGEVYEHHFTYGAPPVATEPGPDLPETYQLGNPYPNPFNPSARFDLLLHQTQHVDIDVITIDGRRVFGISSGTLTAGRAHTFQIDGSGMASGIYLLRVRGEDFSDTRTITLMK